MKRCLHHLSLEKCKLKQDTIKHFLEGYIEVVGLKGGIWQYQALAKSETIGILIHWWTECKMEQPLW